MDRKLASAINDVGLAKILSRTFNKVCSSFSGDFLGFKYHVRWTLIPGKLNFVEVGNDYIIRTMEWDVRSDISFSYACDLSKILPRICIPPITIDIPKIGKVTLPEQCLDTSILPIITIPVDLPPLISEISADVSLSAYHDSNNRKWLIKGKCNLLTFDIDPIDIADTAKTIFEETLGKLLKQIPAIGPFLEDIISWFLANVFDLIDDLMEFLLRTISDELRLHPKFGIEFDLHSVDEIFEIMPASANEPAVTVRINGIEILVSGTQKKELCLFVDIDLP